MSVWDWPSRGRRALERFVRWLVRRLTPRKRTAKGLKWGALVALALFGGRVGLELETGLPAPLDFLLGIGLLFAFLGLAGLAIQALRRALHLGRRWLTLAGLQVVLAVLLLLSLFGFPWVPALIAAFTVALLGGLSGAALIHLLDTDAPTGRRRWAGVGLGLLVVLTVGLIVFLFDEGSTEHLVTLPDVGEPPPTLDAPDPSEAGPYEVERLTYGSGTDRWRPEFGEEVDVVTDGVDGTAFTDGFEGLAADARELYWGFGMDEMPINGRVFLPVGEGPFPVVLMVHGNHTMTEFSDVGYDWLGEHLASHGWLMVSVDENFLNSAPVIGGVDDENDARGWVLLQHLQALRDVHLRADTPLAGKLDLSRVALMGHSRGGEAVAIAAAFDRLERYPDDATVDLGPTFDVRALVAFAPVDGQYLPSDHRTPLTDVSYLLLHGGHDGDVSSFSGDRQFDRIRFSPGDPHFAASLWIYRANHGQWNTAWGNEDLPWPWAALLNKEALLDPVLQKKIALVYVTAFLSEAFEEPGVYRPLFRDPRVGRRWLPDEIYVTRYRDAGFRPVADFEEDVDVTSASLAGARWSGRDLVTWREAEIEFRSGSGRDDHAVFLGWRGPASYALELPPGSAGGEELSGDAYLALSLAATDETPKTSADDGETDDGDEDSDASKDSASPWDLTLELTTTDGVTVGLPLSRFRALPPPLPSRFTRWGMLNKKRYAATEIVFQDFEIPLAAFTDAEPGFDPSQLSSIRFVFDREPESGVVVLDDVGFGSRPAAQ